MKPAAPNASAGSARWMRVLVTGLAGFLGSNLLEGLLREGRSVVDISPRYTGGRFLTCLPKYVPNSDEWLNTAQFVNGTLNNNQVIRAVNEFVAKLGPTSGAQVRT